MDSLTLKCFGVGDGAPDSDRNHASFLYQFPKESFLLDCGEPLSRSFKAAGVDLESFNRIVISHLHSDHVGGFFMFIQGLWLERRAAPVTVHLPHDAIKPIQQMLDAVYLFSDVLPFSLTFEPLRAGEALRFGEVKVTAFRTAHLDKTRAKNSAKYPGNYDAFCFLIQTSTMRIGHSADLDSPRDLSPLLNEPLDLLVCELAHFQPKELFTALQGRQIRKLAIVHLSGEHWAAQENLLELARTMLPEVQVVIPCDNEDIRMQPIAPPSLP
jgi:hypothetical protein